MSSSRRHAQVSPPPIFRTPSPNIDASRSCSLMMLKQQNKFRASWFLYWRPREARVSYASASKRLQALKDDADVGVSAKLSTELACLMVYYQEVENEMVEWAECRFEHDTAEDVTPVEPATPERLDPVIAHGATVSGSWMTRELRDEMVYSLVTDRTSLSHFLSISLFFSPHVRPLSPPRTKFLKEIRGWKAQPLLLEGNEPRWTSPWRTTNQLDGER